MDRSFAVKLPQPFRGWPLRVDEFDGVVHRGDDALVPGDNLLIAELATFGFQDQETAQRPGVDAEVLRYQFYTLLERQWQLYAIQSKKIAQAQKERRHAANEELGLRLMLLASDEGVGESQLQIAKRLLT